jgi:molybdopterin-guanine dinucleotide biosynthesis protein A
MVNKKDITGIILAGGKSSRMGTDKGFLKLNGKKFVQYSIDALKPLVSEIIIVSDNPKYDSFGYKRVNDLIKNAGPVSGIYSGLKTSKSIYSLILSCDIPLISREILQKLIDAIDDTSEVIQVESQGKSMPLIALYKRPVKDVFLKLLHHDERRLRIAVNACKTKNIKLDKEFQFYTLNVNTPNELKAIIDEHNH